jgi:peptide/nickel transport system substrate-binding protein
MTRVVGASIGAVLVGLILAASGTTGRGKDGGTLRIGIPAENLDTVDWALAASPGPFVALGPTCASLLALPDKPVSAGRRPIPEVASGLPKISNGGRTYTFTIRKGLRFSTGAPVTARDVAHTINRLLDPAMKSVAAGYFLDIVGAHEVLAGKTRVAKGVIVRGNTLTIRLTKALGDFEARAAVLCIVPRALPPDPEGAKPPIPSAGPYYVAEYVPGEHMTLERNSFYRGSRPHHVDTIDIDLSQDASTFLDRVDRGELDYAWVPTSTYADRALEFRRKYGLNKARFFSSPADFLRFFSLNTSRPLFRNNPALRRALNFAIDRKALLRERGPLVGSVTDQYLPASIPGYRDERIYPLGAPNVARARALAKGNTRTGKATLYAPATPLGAAQAQIVRQDLKRIGITVAIRQFPVSLYFEKLANPREPYDIAWNGWLANLPDPDLLNDLFSGASIGNPAAGNNSHFNAPVYNTRLEAASRLTGSARYRAYGRLDVDLVRDAAPAVAYAYDSALTLVSQRTGCVVVNPYLDLAAACLK